VFSSTLTTPGPLLTPDDPTVKAIPGWAQQLQREAAKAGVQPAAAAAAARPIVLRGAAVVQTAAGLAEAVARDPAVWCGGTRESRCRWPWGEGA
jgi:hypothetical protein